MRFFVEKAYKRLMKNSTFRAASLMSFANIVALGLGFFAALIIPKALGSYEYGIFSMISNILGLLSVLFEFGLFVSAGRYLLMVQSESEDEKILNAVGFIVLIIAIAFAFCTYYVSFFIDNFLHNKIGEYLRNVSYYSIAMVFPFALDSVLKAAGKINRLAAYNIISKAVYVGAILLSIWADMFSLTLCLYFFLLAPIVTFIGVWMPWLCNKTRYNLGVIKKIWEINCTFGLKNYLGRVLSTPMNYLTGLLIGHFIGITDMGVFSLCLIFCAPLQPLANAIVVAKYKEFMAFKPFSQTYLKWFFITIVLCACGVFGIGAGLFLFYYKGIYIHYIGLLGVVVFSQLIGVAYIPFNNWLVANAQGDAMLLTSVMYGIIQIITAYFFIQIWGIYGAAVSYLCARGYFLLHTLWFYYALKCKV